MTKGLRSNTISTGLAMFSMFFGAGNIVFPLTIGSFAQDKVPFAIFGLLLSAVCVPFLGLISMILFNGDYRKFFERVGKVPGFSLMVLILCLIGPFGAIPRCVSLSHSTLGMVIPDVSILIFSAVACLIILGLTIKPSSLLEILGYVLTPFLLISLLIIIIKGVWTSSSIPTTDLDSMAVFIKGLKDGYQTMDLLGAFFFSSIVVSCLQEEQHPHKKQDYKRLTYLALKASLVGAVLLGVIYIGFCYLSALYSADFAGVTSDKLLGEIALKILGPYAGIVTSVAVALACLTTAIALTIVFAEFLQKDIFKNKIGYLPCLLVTLVITYIVSTLHFSGIVSVLAPVLAVCYPSLIVLSILNIAYKLFNFKPVKVPVLLVFFFSLYEFLPNIKELF